MKEGREKKDESKITEMRGRITLVKLYKKKISGRREAAKMR